MKVSRLFALLFASTVTCTLTAAVRKTTFVVTIKPSITLSLTASSISSGSTLSGSIKLSESAGVRGVLVSLASSASDRVSISPSTMNIAAGQSTGRFTISGGSVGPSTLMATSAGYTPARTQVTDTPSAPRIMPSPGTYLAGQQVTLANAMGGAVLHYTRDGSTPSLSSPVFTSPLVLLHSETIRSIAVVAGISSPAASANFTITPAHLVFSVQPTSAPMGAVLNPAPTVSVVDTNGNLLSSAAGWITLSLGANTAKAALNGSTTQAAVHGIASFPNLSVSVSGTYTINASAPGLTSSVSTTFKVALPTPASFPLAGLISPAIVAESIFVQAPGVPRTAVVTYFVDDHLIATEKTSPFWMGGQTAGAANGFSTPSVGIGVHTLRAVATLPDGTTLASDNVSLTVIPSLNQQLSATLTAYPNQGSAQQGGVAVTLSNTATAGAVLTPAESQTRQQVLAMYMNWGIDPSLDYLHDQSDVLAQLAPKLWASGPKMTSGMPLSLLFSPDAPFYQRIPKVWPRVALPLNYFHMVQLNTTSGGDGLGYGQTAAGSLDSKLEVRSEWYTNVNTLRVFSFPMSSSWSKNLPANPAGDSHMIFVDPVSATFLSSYKTTLDTATTGPDALYTSNPSPLNSLGDRGGSTASGFAELPVLIQPGEATNPSQPIAHAIGGPVGRTWAARVYPASAWDAGVRTSTNSCSGTGFTNTGLIPYGGVIQLDPALDLTKLGLTLPALRILQAMQTYGYYVMDFGCADFDIYTSISETELDPYGGLWGYNRKGPGVQNEVEAVITTHTLFVIAPLTKKQ